MISLDIFIHKIKSNEIQVIPKGTKFKMLDRIDINPDIENPKAQLFNSWIGRKGVLGGDIYVGEYPILEEEEKRKFLLSDDYISLHAKLKFDKENTIFTSNIKSATFNTGISIVETENTIYVLDILELGNVDSIINITLANEVYEWDYVKNPHILIESFSGIEKSVALEYIKKDIENNRFNILFINAYTDKNTKETIKELLNRNFMDEKIFVVIDGIEVLVDGVEDELYMEREIEELIMISRKLNINLICGSRKMAPVSSLLRYNFPIKMTPILNRNDIKNCKWILTDGIKERIVDFPIQRSE